MKPCFLLFLPFHFPPENYTNGDKNTRRFPQGRWDEWLSAAELSLLADIHRSSGGNLYPKQLLTRFHTSAWLYLRRTRSAFHDYISSFIQKPAFPQSPWLEGKWVPDKSRVQTICLLPYLWRISSTGNVYAANQKSTKEAVSFILQKEIQTDSHIFFTVSCFEWLRMKYVSQSDLFLACLSTFSYV